MAEQKLNDYCLSMDVNPFSRKRERDSILDSAPPSQAEED